MKITVGAHAVFDQQLGLRRSWPVYLGWNKKSEKSPQCRSPAHQVIVTGSDFPFPLRPFMTAPISCAIFKNERAGFFLGTAFLEEGSRGYLYWRLLALKLCHPLRGSKVYESPRECALAYLLLAIARAGELELWLIAVAPVIAGRDRIHITERASAARRIIM